MSALRKVLVVDDDPVVARSVNRVLAAKGYAVITAENGEDALHKLVAEQYDLVFTDIKMPGISGIEVAERIKASQPWLPVVIITGYGSQADETRAAAAGVSGFLNKPLSPEMIESSASHALEAHRELAAPAVAEAGGGSTAAVEAEDRARSLAMFFAAPFLGLAYLIAAPLVGMAALVWFAAKALGAGDNARHIATAVAAPVVGMAFLLALPVVGLGALAWIGLGAMFKE